MRGLERLSQLWESNHFIDDWWKLVFVLYDPYHGCLPDFKPPIRKVGNDLPGPPLFPVLWLVRGTTPVGRAETELSVHLFKI